jgi:repressor LexA
MKGLTDRQQRVLDYIVDRVRETGYPPTIREIGTALDIRSTNGVNDHLKALERKGYIERDESKSRAIQLRADLRPSTGRRRAEPADASVVRVPLLGRIAAGSPIEAVETAERHVVVGPEMFGRRGAADVFALEVEGESMVDDGILDGDVVFVRSGAETREGSIVAVVVDGAATVKRWYREPGRVRLEPSNAAMSPFWIEARAGRDAAILGPVVGLLRRM